MDIEKHEFDVFMEKWKKGKYAHQRFGQAFYNHFDLHKLADQNSLKNLHSKDGEHALGLIKQIFNFK